MNSETTIILETSDSELQESPLPLKEVARPQAVLNPTGIKKKKKKKPGSTDPEDPEDPEASTPPEDPDDDDDGETDPADSDDDGTEDENELTQSEEKKQTSFKQPFHLQKSKPIENKKEHPKDPQKIERSPLQQMFDFLLHGVKGAQIKNGELPLKASIADSLLAGFGFKSYKKEILIQEQAQKFWLKKIFGRGEDTSLLNTDLADKKLKKQEEPSLKNIQINQVKKERETIHAQTVRQQQVLSEQINSVRREELRIQQEINKTVPLHLTNPSSKINAPENMKVTIEKEKQFNSKTGLQKQPETTHKEIKTSLPSNKAELSITHSVPSDSKSKQEHKEQDFIIQQQQRLMEQNQEAQRQAMNASFHQIRPPHPRHPILHPPHHLGSGPKPGNVPNQPEVVVGTKLVSMGDHGKGESNQVQQPIQQQQQLNSLPPQGQESSIKPQKPSEAQISPNTCPIGSNNDELAPLPKGKPGATTRLGEAGNPVNIDQQPSEQERVEQNQHGHGR